jgi:hypothetical protein
MRYMHTGQLHPGTFVRVYLWSGGGLNFCAKIKKKLAASYFCVFLRVLLRVG